MTVEINNKTKSRIDFNSLKKIVRKFFKVYKIKDKDVSIAFVGDRKSKNLNKKYRNKNKPTDVLSFAGDNGFFGEIIIDYQQIKRQAKKFGNSVKAELCFILVHGLLHLAGYDDKKEPGRLEMEKLAQKFMGKLKI